MLQWPKYNCSQGYQFIGASLIDCMQHLQTVADMQQQQSLQMHICRSTQLLLAAIVSDEVMHGQSCY